MSTFTDLTTSIDALTAMESGVESLEEFQEIRAQKAPEVARCEAVIRAAGSECKSLAHMQNLHSLVQRYGIEYRSRVWCSVAGSSMSRLWVGMNGWEI